MSREFLTAAADALRFSAGLGTRNGGENRELQSDRRLGSYTAGEWKRNIAALDRSGLTLPLYARLIERDALAALPTPVVAMLEQRRQDNARRMSAMLQTFEHAAQALRRADVRFACLKGFSLVPEFAPELWQRHQIDFDLLVAPEAMDRAQSALEPLGYIFVGGDRDERRLRIPLAQTLGRDAYVYQMQQGAAVELHSRFWEAGGAGLEIRGFEDVLDSAVTHRVEGVEFLRLAQPYALFYQVLHFLRHFMASWARPLWLYEIAAFTHRSHDDDALWRKVYELATADGTAAKAVAMTLLAAQQLFESPVPAALRGVCDVPAHSPIALWIEHYAKRWLLADMPGNKLNLLLHRHFIPDDNAWRAYLLRRLLPIGSRPNLCEGIAAGSRRRFRYRISSLRYLAGRMGYHLRTDLELAMQSVAWKKLNKPGVRTVTSASLSRSEL